MEIIIVGVVLGAIALFALYRPNKPGSQDIIVRFYANDTLLLKVTGRCTWQIVGDSIIVKKATISDVPKDMALNRITLALPQFSEKEAELRDVEPFSVGKGSDITLVPQPGEPGILIVN